LYRPPKSKDGQTIDWGAPIVSSWDISESAALKLLDEFLAPGGGLGGYEGHRSYADGRAVSRLSPYLSAGQLSVRYMWQRMREAR
jgi:deoxyribodipyrimidine photolyase